MRAGGLEDPLWSTARIAMRHVAEDWLKDPELRAEYEALEPEVALAAAPIEARSRARMTQAQVAEAMGTTFGAPRGRG